MDARTVNNLPPTATHDGTARCLMAIELSKKSWIIGVNTWPALQPYRGKPAVFGSRRCESVMLYGR